MRGVDFVRALESFYEKELPVERIRAINEFIVSEKINEEELLALYNKVIANNNTNFFPAFNFIITMWKELSLEMRERKMDDEMSDLARRNKDMISSWWSYPARRILFIVDIINKKKELDYTDREFKNVFDFVFYEVSVMRKEGWLEEDVLKRVEYIMNSTRMKAPYDKLESKPIQVELFK